MSSDVQDLFMRAPAPHWLLHAVLSLLLSNTHASVLGPSRISDVAGSILQRLDSDITHATRIPLLGSLTPQGQDTRPSSMPPCLRKQRLRLQRTLGTHMKFALPDVIHLGPHLTL